MESNPIAAVRNNALGTWELARIAARFGAGRLLMISTDKAVNPRSVMGASQRVAELALLRMSDSKAGMTSTKMNAVRLGNAWVRTEVLARCFSSKFREANP
jgi:FlaA1/EpsC-like NDP-sugar epimerase